MNDYKLTQGSSLILDLIRGISAQLVVVGHGIIVFKIFDYSKYPAMQNIAVLVFFLLSGFLITYSTTRKKLNKESYSFKIYFIDRFSRIYTAFVPALIFVLLIDFFHLSIIGDSFKFSNSFDLKHFIGNFFMLQDFPIFKILPNQYSISSFGSARPFWTLAIEWWIYLFFGYFILVVCKKNQLSFKNLIFLGFLGIVPLFNSITGRGSGLFIYWIFGAIIYLLVTLNLLKNLSFKIKLSLTFVLMVLAIGRIAITMKEYEPIFAFLLSLILLLLIDIFKNVRFNELYKRLIRFIASYSYTLYLIHFSILQLLVSNQHYFGNRYILFVLGFILSNIISIAIARYTEITLTQKVKYFLYKMVNSESSSKKLNFFS